MEGKIRSIPQDKNFGFIKGNEGGDYFFHQSDFHGHWDDLVFDFNNTDDEEKIAVKFEPAPSDKGLRASNVSRLDFPNSVNGV